MEDLNIRFGMKREEMKIAPDNAYDYFEKLFGMPPLDYFLLELPIDSPCGRDCKEAMDCIYAFFKNPRFDIAYRMAIGHIDSCAYEADFKAMHHHRYGYDYWTIEQAATIAFNAIEIYWRG